VKTAVRGLLKGMRASDDFFKELDSLIARRCKQAIVRARGTGGRYNSGKTISRMFVRSPHHHIIWVLTTRRPRSANLDPSFFQQFNRFPGAA
jgi:hypothetical protein